MVQDRIYNYFERNPQLHVLFIFDRMNIIQNELDEMKQWNDDYIYKVFKMDKAQVKRILKDLWKLPHADNALSYSTYVIDRDNTTGYAEVRRIGRFYTVSHDNISHLL